MSDNAETVDLSGLTAKRDELLAKVKELKGRIAELEGERDAILAQATESAARFKAEVIDRPVDEVLADLVLIPLRHVKPEIEAHFTFELGDDGAIQVRDKDGKPVVVDGREIQCTRGDMMKALATVGTLDEVLRGTLAKGAGGTSKNEGLAASEPVKAKQVASPFGLR